MKTIQEIQTALDALVVDMTLKGVKTPEASVRLWSGSRHSVSISSAVEDRPFDGEHYKYFYSDNLAECFADAAAYIAALPSPEEKVTRTYLRKVADAVDYATENSIADEYVQPLRCVSCAMTSNLLTKEGDEK